MTSISTPFYKWHGSFPVLHSVKLTHHSAECHFVESHSDECLFNEYQSAAKYISIVVQP
jgi:hypothetical protein